MKKFTYLALAMAFGAGAFAQSQRTCLSEEFTQASCGPCAAQNPAYNQVLTNNSSKVISLKYQVSWPGVDPMNAQNPGDPSTRVSYYGVSGVPDVYFDGNVYAGAPSGVNNTVINNRYAVTSPFNITVSHSIPSDLDSVYVTVNIECTQNVTGTLVAHTVIAERMIKFMAPPGSNGETEFFPNICRKMLPSASGTTLATSWTAGQTQTLTFAVKKPAYIYDPSEIAVVAFIQDNTSKEVKQAGYSAPQPIPNDAKMESVSGISGSPSCNMNLNPSVTFKNLSAAVMTSAEIRYKIDATGTINTYNWSGSVNPGQTTTATLPTITATGGSHKFFAYVKMPNGQTDANTFNDSSYVNFALFATPVGANVVEQFTATAYPPTNWVKEDVEGDNVSWSRKSGAGATGGTTASSKMDFYNSAPGNTDNLYVKPLNLSGASAPSMTFYKAYAQYQAENDYLGVDVSTDCGVTWNNVWNESGTALSTASPTTSAFTPTASQWAQRTVDLSAYAGQSNVIVRFNALSEYGNNAYVDEINISGVVGVKQVQKAENINIATVYPNPTADIINIKFNLDKSERVKVELYNVVGEKVYSFEESNMTTGEHLFRVSTEELATGVYMMNFTTGNNTVTKKVNVVR